MTSAQRYVRSVDRLLPCQEMKLMYTGMESMSERVPLTDYEARSSSRQRQEFVHDASERDDQPGCGGKRRYVSRLHGGVSAEPQCGLSPVPVDCMRSRHVQTPNQRLLTPQHLLLGKCPGAASSCQTCPRTQWAAGHPRRKRSAPAGDGYASYGDTFDSI
ncbi:unnamed protein product [Boreogadus saida]